MVDREVLALAEGFLMLRFFVVVAQRVGQSVLLLELRGSLSADTDGLLREAVLLDAVLALSAFLEEFEEVAAGWVSIESLLHPPIKL